MSFPQFHNLGSLDREFEDLPVNDEDSSPLDQPIGVPPPRLVAACSLIALTLIVGTLFYQQVVKGGSNFLLAERNRVRLERIPAPRGIIFDRSGTPLVRNVASYELVIRVNDLPSDFKDRDHLITQISSLTQIPVNQINDKIDKARQTGQLALLKTNLSQDEALHYQTVLADFSTAQVAKIPQRVYLEEAALAHLVGYVGKPDEDYLKNHPQDDPSQPIGKAGLEKVYEQFLKGSDGARQIEVDSVGQLQRVLSLITPRQGNNLTLTIDFDLQKVLSEALGEGLQNSGSKKGAAVAIDPQNGEVLALVSLPTFDNNAFAQADEQKLAKIFGSPLQPLVNRAIGGVYVSGSSIKPLWAVAGLVEKVVDEKVKFDTPPEITIGEFVFPDWRDHGVTDIKTAIAESNNIFFYALTGGWGPIKGLGINKLVDYMKLVGFGQKTGIDLTAEQAGFVPTPEWKKRTRGEPWYIGDTYHLGIGQGDIAVTPLQLLLAQTAIWNGGKLLTPHVGKEILDDEGKLLQTIQPAARKDNLFNDKSRAVVKEGMRQTVTSGSARAIADLKDKTGLPVEAAAKTGTAQFGNEGKTHAWFVVFAPYPDPTIAMIVLVEGGGEGHATALPVAKKTLQWWFGR